MRMEVFAWMPNCLWRFEGGAKQRSKNGLEGNMKVKLPDWFLLRGTDRFVCLDMFELEGPELRSLNLHLSGLGKLESGAGAIPVAAPFHFSPHNVPLP